MSATSSVDLFILRTQSAASQEAVKTYLSTLPSLPRFARYRQYIIYHKGDFVALFKEKFSGIEPRAVHVNKDAAVFEIEYDGLKSLTTDDNKARAAIAILPGSQPNFHRIVTVSYSFFWNRAVERMVRHLYPSAISVFFKQNEMKAALNGLEQLLSTKYNLTISEYIAKRKLDNKESRTDKLSETRREWLNLSVNETFSRSLESRHWFVSIEFVIARPGQTVPLSIAATGRIHKRGYIQYDGFHDLITSSIIEELESFASQRMRFLSGRGKRERNYRPGPPIAITYDEELFSDKEQIKDFSKVIEKYPHSTKVILHRNPYYHASIADFLDGSSLDLWILSSKRVLIVPQVKTSERALERIVSYIFSNYHEGDLEDYHG